ncbi:YusW family protein [Paenibacillus thermoaerophilus]|uniref:YusW family protein n=1 Tax=Paenibacillus thermoaerophilus TaxID=1215385 RepID=A0ABW2V898_9BACL|nr:YusW family protein [Paenibacillus thermoaerophilus]
MHGIVMKITEQCIVVLCEDGKFRNLPHPPVMPKLGDAIPVPAAEITIKRSRWQRLQKYRFLAATLLLLCGITMLFTFIEIPAQPVALVAIDINPGFELFVDRKGKIKKAVLVNDDANWIVPDQQLIGKEFYAAARIIINKAEEQGYLGIQADKRWIWVSVVDFGPSSFDVDVNKIISESRDYRFEKFDANEQQMEQAKKAGLTLNKYMVYERAKQIGIELDVEQLRSHSITSSFIRAGIDPEQFFEKPSENMDATGNQITEEIFRNGSAHEAKPSYNTPYAVQPVQTAPTSVLPNEQNGQNEQTEATQRVTKDGNENLPATGYMEKSHPKPNAQEMENSPSEQEKANVREFELRVTLDQEQKIKLEYKNEEGRITAEGEKETSQGKERLQGEQAIQYLNGVIQKLRLVEKMNKLTLAKQISSVLNFREDQWIEMEIEIEFSNGETLEFELTNFANGEEEKQEKEKESNKDDDE